MPKPAPIVEVRGRKRKPGPRHECGKLVQDKPIDAKIIALRMPHRADVPADMAHDPKAESHLGRLNLRKEITDIEYDAGVWWRGCVNRYRVLIGAPSPNMQSVSAEGSVRGMPSVIDRDESERRTTTYNNAFAAILEAGQQKGAREFSRIAVYDETPRLDCRRMFRLAALGLAIHRGTCSERQALDIRREIVNKFPK